MKVALSDDPLQLIEFAEVGFLGEYNMDLTCQGPTLR